MKKGPAFPPALGIGGGVGLGFHLLHVLDRPVDRPKGEHLRHIHVDALGGVADLVPEGPAFPGWHDRGILKTGEGRRAFGPIGTITEPVDVPDRLQGGDLLAAIAKSRENVDLDFGGGGVGGDGHLKIPIQELAGEIKINRGGGDNLAFGSGESFAFDRANRPSDRASLTRLAAVNAISNFERDGHRVILSLVTHSLCHPLSQNKTP